MRATGAVTIQTIMRSAWHHWFYLSLPVLLGMALTFRATHPWADQPVLGEATTLFDWCLFVPFLYVLCYRHMPRRALALRTLALMCGGLWIAGKLVPDPAEAILSQWGWLRGVGLTVLVIAEAVASIAILRLAFGTAPDATKLEQQGIPPSLAKLMLAEARFWRAIWASLRGK